MMEVPDNRVMNEDLWDIHLSRQFGWTKKLRESIYDLIDLKSQKKILDAGCGIGLVSREMAEISGGQVHGVDLNPRLVKKAKENYPRGHFQTAAIEKLPFGDGLFDVAFCHFVLMWVKNPRQALTEMMRVTRPGGWIVCAAEPDYGGKIDYPDDYNMVASSIRALQQEGANPFFGRRLKATFSGCGLKPEMGAYVDLWDDETLDREFEKTWDFQAKTSRTPLAKQWLKTMKDRDREAIDKGERVTLLVLFWGAARKPAESAR
jgi:ubiquinone/menaquinone biosynthesis C-methylase UbiE